MAKHVTIDCFRFLYFRVVLEFLCIFMEGKQGTDELYF
jgi:hypothetical protein